MDVIDRERLRRARMQAQGLAGAGFSNVEEAVAVLIGVQAQELPSATQAIQPRSRNLMAADVAAARVEARSVIWTWCMRGTLHLIARADAGWLLPLFGPAYIQKGGRRFAELGIDEDNGPRAVAAIERMLAEEGPLTRAEIRGRLAAQRFPFEGQATYYLMWRAALSALACYGPERDGEATFVRLADWTPVAPVGGEDVPGELARRYLGGYGPASLDDFSTWMGLGKSTARQGFEAIADERLGVEYEGETLWLLNQHADRLDAPRPAAPLVRLIPAYDAYLLGYTRRDFLVADEYAKRIHPGGGLIRPTVLVDGQAAGTWKSKAANGRLRVTVSPFEPLGEAAAHGLAEAVNDLGRFAGTDDVEMVMA